MQFVDYKYIYYSFPTCFHLGHPWGYTAMTQFLELPVATVHSGLPELMFVSPPLGQRELIMAFPHHLLVLNVLIEHEFWILNMAFPPY
jgi:hypothetical protein